MFKKLLAGFLCAVMTASAVPAIGVSAADDYSSDLRLLYTFDGDEKNASDSTKNKLDGQIFGTTEISDDAVSGQSLLLKGGYVLLPEDIVNGLTDVSISVWTKPMRAAEDSRLWDIGSNDQNFLNLFAPLAGNKYASALRINNSAQRAESANNCFETKKWQHLVVTYSELDSGRITIYKNGEQIASLATDTSARKVSMLGKVTNAAIGRAQFAKDPDYYGYVDNFEIYSSALSASDVQDLYGKQAENLAATTANNLDLAAENGLSSLDGVIQNLTLPKADGGLSVAWSSDNKNVIADNGKLGGTLGNAVLTATVSGFGKTAEHKFNITVTNDKAVADPIADVVTVPGSQPKLPEKITANSGKASLSVDWEALSPNDYAFAGTKTVKGTASNGQAVSVTLNIDDSYIKNPIIEQGSAGGSPDPYIAYKDGYYYYVRHNYNTGITVSKAKRLQDIESAPRIVVYTAPASGMYSKEYWAPEIHYIDGNWYIYFAADDGNNANHRMYCIKSTDPENAQAQYEMMGQVTPTEYNEATSTWETKQDENKWAIDGTVLQDVNGKNYFVWSGWEGNTDGRQNTYIAEMLNPWTLKGSRVLLSTPSQPWERKQLDGDCLVHEGQQIIKRGNKIHILYSTNHSGRDLYCLGLLTMDANSDPLDPASWTKSAGPLFTQSLDPADQSYGTGHAMLTPSPDGNDWYLIYHAFQTSGGGWTDRSARALKVTWDGDYPVFGNPVAPGILMKEPSGTDNSIVAGKYEAEKAVLSGSARATKMNRPSGGYVVSNITKTSTVTFNVNVPASGRYLVSFMGNSRVSSGKCYQDVTINGVKHKIVHSGTNNDQGIWRPSADALSENGDGLHSYLRKGENTITVTQSSDSAGAADLDYLYLVFESAVSESIALDKSSLELNEGDKAAIKADVSGAGENPQVVWSSSDVSVATVDQNGNVIALKAGTAVITAALAENPEINASCEVTVKSAPTPPTPTPTPTPSVPKNGTKVINGKTVLYQNSKAVTGTKIVTVGGKTYAVVNGYVPTGISTRLVKIGKKVYVIDKSGIVVKAKANKLVKIGSKTYVVSKNGTIVKAAKNKLVKVGKKSYIVNKQGVVLKNKKSVKIGKKTYKVSKKGVATLAKKK